MPDTLELWIGTLDEDILIGKPVAGQEGKEAAGQKVEREGGWGVILAKVKETLYWGNVVPGVTDGGAASEGKKWWGMIGKGESF